MLVMSPLAITHQRTATSRLNELVVRASTSSAESCWFKPQPDIQRLVNLLDMVKVLVAIW